MLDDGQHFGDSESPVRNIGSIISNQLNGDSLVDKTLPGQEEAEETGNDWRSGHVC